MSQISYQFSEFNAPLKKTSNPLPTPLDDEILVKITYCGVCHSDVHFHEGHFDMGEGHKMELKTTMPLPMTPGHEITGIVEQLGSAVKNVKKGDRVALFPSSSCGDCDFCKSNREEHCPFQKFYGNTMQGGFSSHVIAKAEQAAAYGKADAAFAATCCCSGITTYAAIKKLGNLTNSDKILFFGAGGLGMMALQLFKTLHPNHPGPIMADIDPAKLEIAKSLGASGTINMKTDQRQLNQYAKASWLGEGFSGILDFVGSGATVTQGTFLLNRHGKLVVVGLLGGSGKISAPILPLKGIQILGNYLGTLQEFKELMKIIETGKIAPPPLIVRPLSEATQALIDLKEGRVMGRTVLKVDASASL